MKPHTRVTWSIAIFLINLSLPLAHFFWRFMPDDRAAEVATIYALACAWFHFRAVRSARSQELQHVELQTSGMRKLLKKSLFVTVFVQLFVGWIGFALGGAHLYTLVVGNSAEVTRVVEYSEWKGKTRRGGNCFKHYLAGSSAIENKLGSPCLDVGYGSGTRFHFRGRASSLGLHVEEMTIEPRGKTRIRGKS